MTNHFLRVRYGNFEATETLFHAMRDLQKEVEKGGGGMKGNHWFIAGIIVFLVLMFAIECRLPKKFVWNPTFSHYDKQPFGCAVFDSLLSSSLPKGYSLSRKTFYELEQEDTTLRRGILVVTDNLHLTDVDVEAMLKMAGRGDRIMLVGSSFQPYFERYAGI